MQQGEWIGYQFKNEPQRRKLLAGDEDVQSKGLDLVQRVLKTELYNTYGFS